MSYPIRILIPAAMALGALLSLTPHLSAQESMGTPAAKAKLEAAKAAMKTNDFVTAIADLKEAIELDPNFVEPHDQFRSAYSQSKRGATPIPNDHTVEKTYEAWAAKYPDKAGYLWMLADLNLYDDYKKTEAYAKKAIKIDRKFAPAYNMLALVEEARGNEKKRQAYLKRAAKAAPKDPSWTFYYANSLRYSNPKVYRVAALDVAKRFPNHERGAQALYWLGEDSAKQADAIKYFEQLKASYPPNKFNWSDSGMSSLFNIYNQTDPARALALAKEMTTLKPDDKSWQDRAAYEEAVTQAAALVASGNPSEAVRMLEATKPPRFIDASPYYLTKAAGQDAAGNTRAAYDGLLEQMGQTPSDTLKAALTKYGEKLARTKAQVSGDLWAQLQAKAKPAPELDTTRFGDEKKVTLADYRGKVVLLNFWYPFCGPCRGEFPYLQAILNKYGPQGFVIVSPSVHPAEDALVLPYMNGMHWGFIPIHSDTDYATKAYSARGFPSNFLIDQEGRVLYKPGVIRGAEAQRTLELQIEAVLEHGGSPAHKEAGGK